MSELLPKKLLYFTLRICQQRVSQVFFDIIHLIFVIVHMTSSRLLPASAAYRNAQLMDSLLSYFSSKRHIVFSEPVIKVVYCHSTFFLVLTPLQWIYTDLNHTTERCAPSTPAPTTAACTKQVMSPLSERNLILLCCICFNCSIKYVYTNLFF